MKIRLVERGPKRRVPTRARGGRSATALTLLAALTATAVTVAQAETEPVGRLLVAVTVSLATCAAGGLLAQWRWIAFLGVPIAAVLLLGLGGLDNTLAAAYALIFYTPVLLMILALGVGGAKVANAYAPRARKHARRLAWVGLLAGFLPLPVMVVQANRTVHADHTAGPTIDENAGVFRSLRLGDRAARVSAVIGPPAALAHISEGKIGPTVGSGSTDDGPSSIAGEHDVFLRYPYLSFDIRRGRINWIQIEDPRIGTGRHVGVGDSIGLIPHAYPHASCGEDSLGSEEPPNPYPYCQIRTDAGSWLTFYGDYTRPGKPVVAIWLTRRSPESPGGLP